MHEVFTEAAKQILRLASEQAMREQSGRIGTEHILLGLLEGPEGVGKQILTNLCVDAARVRDELQAMPVTDSEGRLLKTHLSVPYSKEVIERAVEEARSLSDCEIGGEHLLLGLLGSSDSPAANVLEKLGVRLEEVRAAIIKLRGTSGKGDSGRRDVFERFTDRARKVMALANKEAHRLNHDHIGTEHILLGLMREGAGVGSNVLKNMGVDWRRVRLEVELLVKDGRAVVTTSKMPQTPRAKRVIEYAIDESRKLNHNYVGSEHILLGLLREADGIAAQVLVKLGLRLEAVREEMLNLLGAGMEPEATGKTNDDPRQAIFTPAPRRGSRLGYLVAGAIGVALGAGGMLGWMKLMYLASS